MLLKIGIIGLPNVGKSTLFKALTKQPIDISNYPFCTINPNIGIVAVPDEKLEAINDVIKTPKITPTVIEFVDIAGLVKNAHQGEGLGNQFLANIREVDAICQIVRDFPSEKIIHVEGRINPQKDIEIINTELIMKDLETVEKRMAKTKDKKMTNELIILGEIKKILEQEKLIRKNRTENMKEILKELGLLTDKPMIYVFNVSNVSSQSDNLQLNLYTEVEISELSIEEINELELQPPQLDKLIKAAYQVLELITFYTIKGGQEVRAWTLKKGLPITTAGGVVHSDFEEKFIKAEVINWQKLIEVGSWSAAREKGVLRIEGKKYIVQDGDVIEFKI